MSKKTSYTLIERLLLTQKNNNAMNITYIYEIKQGTINVNEIRKLVTFRANSLTSPL